jgi:N-acetyl-anhydromuramyl-L-alanine amidase AmpD
MKGIADYTFMDFNSKSRGNAPINLIVVHAMGEYIKDGNNVYSAARFLKKIGLSAHYLVTPSGVILRCVREAQIAWHAKGFNTNSIGIEVSD